MIAELEERVPVRSVLYTSGDRDPRLPPRGGPRANPAGDGREEIPDGRRPAPAQMPEKPTLLDFFKYRFGPAHHLLQSARHARKAGCDEKMILACLLHESPSSASFAATTATGARSSSSPTSTRR